MNELITNSYTELKQLKVNNQYSISKINWWLLKYSDLFKVVSSINNKLCKRCIQLEREGFPIDCISKPNYCIKVPEYSIFIKFYEELDELTEIHKLEYNCLLANDVFLFYDFHQLDLNEWCSNYEKIFQKICLIYNEHLDFDSNKYFTYLTSPDTTFKVIIDKSEFKEIIQFFKYYEEKNSKQQRKKQD